jgi:putative ABC transport system ATP-binding protein
MNNAIITTHNLIKDYGQGEGMTHVLRGLDIDIMKGEFVIIFGPSGSGKSTLLNILTGLEEPTSGTVSIDGQDMLHMTSHEKALFHRTKVGMVFQAYNLIPSLTVIQNIGLPLVFSKISKRDRDERARILLRDFKLEHLANRLPAECSGGQMQRVGIMRALITEPPIIIADEPTGNLDSVSTINVMNMLSELNKKYRNTLLIVTHDGSLARYADRIIHVLDGKVLKETVSTKTKKIHPEKIPFDSVYEQTTIRSRKKMLDILSFLLSRPQLESMNNEEIEKTVDVMIVRYQKTITSEEMFTILDRPANQKGVGLYGPTARHIADHFDSILALIKT